MHKILYANITVANVLERLSLLIRLACKYFDSEYIRVIERAYRDPMSVWSMVVFLLKDKIASLWRCVEPK